MLLSPRLIVLQPSAYCNIDCSYCYLGNRDDRRLMPQAVLEAVRDKILAQLAPGSAPDIVWHAGEPTAVPIAWYERAYEILSPMRSACASFSMQSNGVAIDDRWIDFFERSRTAVNLSIDGPQPFHDARRRTRSGGPTWDLAVRGLRRLQGRGFKPHLITVLHPLGLDHAEAYFRFYRDHDITEVSFSIDEQEGANAQTSLSAPDCKARVTRFLSELIEAAYRDGYPLQVRDMERTAILLAGAEFGGSELAHAWATIVIAVDGKVSTFSPEFMEVRAPSYDNFVFGNICEQDIASMAEGAVFQSVAREVARGLAACEAECRYFHVCGGGSPVNKYCERGDLAATETVYCRLSIQAAADALIEFLRRRGAAARGSQQPLVEAS